MNVWPWFIGNEEDTGYERVPGDAVAVPILWFACWLILGTVFVIIDRQSSGMMSRFMIEYALTRTILTMPSFALAMAACGVALGACVGVLKDRHSLSGRLVVVATGGVGSILAAWSIIVLHPNFHQFVYPEFTALYYGFYSAILAFLASELPRDFRRDLHASVAGDRRELHALEERAKLLQERIQRLENGTPTEEDLAAMDEWMKTGRNPGSLPRRTRVRVRD